MTDPYDEGLRKRKIALVSSAHAIVATIVAVTYLFKNIPKRPYVNKSLQRKDYMDSILLDEDKCRSNLRMGRDAFHRLCALLREKDLLKDTKNLEVEEILVRFLHLLGHNVRHRVLETRFYRSRETISRQFNEALTAILGLYKCLVADHAEYIHNGANQPEISTDSRFATYFKDCVGALDGTHVVATVPEEEQIRFRGRKTRTIQNVLAACSFDLKFTYVLGGWEGTAHDQKVLDNARTRPNPFVVPRGKYYLVDAGYTHETGFLAPYRNTRYHLNEYSTRIPENKKELFNLRHSSLRNAIERAFGLLKKRWPLLSTDSHYPFKTQVKIVVACIILHNHVMGVDPNDPLLAEVDKELRERTENQEEPSPIRSQQTQREEHLRWIQFRDLMAQNMYDEF